MTLTRPEPLRARMTLACLSFVRRAREYINPCGRSIGLRSQARSKLAAALLAASLLPLALPAHSSEGGYRLLELDGDQVKWGETRLGEGASISYAFAGSAMQFETARNCREIAPIESLTGDHLTMETLASEAAAAFRVWERAANLSFHEVSDARDADIILGAQGEPRGRAFADVSHAPDSDSGLGAIEQSLVCMNPEHQWKVGFDGDEEVYDIRYTLIHEIGHAIGLDHPGASGQVMAFSYTEAFDNLQPGDLRGVRLLYGPAAADVGLDESFDSIADVTVNDGHFLGIGRVNVDANEKENPF